MCTCTRYTIVYTFTKLHVHDSVHEYGISYKILFLKILKQLHWPVEQWYFGDLLHN